MPGKLENGGNAMPNELQDARELLSKIWEIVGIGVLEDRQQKREEIYALLTADRTAVADAKVQEIRKELEESLPEEFSNKGIDFSLAEVLLMMRQPMPCNPPSLRWRIGP
jgi:hypothetical protein